MGFFRIAWNGRGVRGRVILNVMQTRRDTLVAALALVTQTVSNAQTQTAQANSGSVLVHDLPHLTRDDWQVTVSEVPYPPGRVGQVHHHAGFVLAYVLEGAVVTKISGQDERIYKAGEMFYEAPGATHEVSKNASPTIPAKLLAFIFAKKGATLTSPGPAIAVR